VKIAVAGLWHLGSVTAACLASAGHEVVGIDEDKAVVDALRAGQPPIAEPGLPELVSAGIESGRLRFSDSFGAAADCDVVWIAWDTPVDENDSADTEFVHSRALRFARTMKDSALMVVSSQMPVQSIRRLEEESVPLTEGRAIDFACVPENLRLGAAIDVFLRPDRVVAGVRGEKARKTLAAIYAPITDRIEWMSVGSAEMTKHAINSFLATSICFINEIAAVCERTGADAGEVERGLKTDKRIGPKAYLHAGPAFAGGTLARDIRFLSSLGEQFGQGLPLINGVYNSNEQQKQWLERRVSEVLGPVKGQTISILGLTYKPGTSTLRRSSAVEAARWLHSETALVQAFDPQVSELPEELRTVIALGESAAAAMKGSAAVVIMTPWPEFRELDAAAFPKVVFDPGRFLDKLLCNRPGTRYFTIGRTN
jgi:UDPglucose 6-dehydrogenase